MPRPHPNITADRIHHQRAITSILIASTTNGRSHPSPKTNDRDICRGTASTCITTITDKIYIAVPRPHPNITADRTHHQKQTIAHI
ncbi:MAG: hypothetical protein AB4352_11725, partial [Hormoscilla sp.]